MSLRCRVCLKENSDNFSIYTFMKKKYLPRVISLISGVKVSQEQEPEAQICHRCAASVLVAENIILRIQESEEYFQFHRLQESNLQSQSQPALEYLSTKGRESISNDYEETQSASTCSGTDDLSNFREPNCADISQCDSQLQLLAEVQPIASNITENPSYHEPKAKRIRSIDDTSVPIFNCDQCDFSTKIGKRIIEHKQTEHDVYDTNIYSCNICAQRFSWKPTLYRHIELEHKTMPIDKKYLCNECGRAYMREVHLIEHIKQRHGPRNFQCPDPLCEQTFTRTFTLRRHFITSHTDQTSTRYHCVDCDKYFKVYDQWKYHNEVIHKKERVYCPHCGYPFRLKEKLDEHILTDVCKRSIVPCSYCQRRFTTKTGLREHVRNIHNIY